MRRTISSGYPSEDAYGYSRAVRAGDHVYVSGTTARDADLDGDTYHQACRALDIVADALREAGAELRHVVRTVAYVRDMGDADAVARAHSERFADIRPASTIVEVSGLSPNAARVEIEVTAVVIE